jgi:hypothetical protein
MTPLRAVARADIAAADRPRAHLRDDSRVTGWWPRPVTVTSLHTVATTG